jgi:hypothetical protein
MRNASAKMSLGGRSRKQTGTIFGCKRRLSQFAVNIGRARRMIEF